MLNGPECFPTGPSFSRDVRTVGDLARRPGGLGGGVDARKSMSAVDEAGLR